MDTLRDADGLIDVRKLIAHYSAQQHQARADAYFGGYDERSVLLRKPFQGVDEAAQITQGLSIMFRELRLFPGARVMDFGAGTAWLSRMLAYLNCEAIAVDLSRSALELGRKVNDKDNFAGQLKISYVPYDGVHIPIPDSHVERICCFDSFHHVADQKTTLAEFFRVMKPGGIAAFHEPGPYHSRLPDSQREMANYNVIENDIHIEDIERMAREIGFAQLKVAWYMPRPLLLDVSTFSSMLDGTAARAEQDAVVARSRGDLQNMRVFFLYKPGAEVADSRTPRGLKAHLELTELRRQGSSFVGSIEVRNVGASMWLPSSGDTGGVRLGVQVTHEDGRMATLDYARFAVSDVPLSPGESRTVEFRFPVPDLPRYHLVFDLVSELVTWFTNVGSECVTVRWRDLPA